MQTQFSQAFDHSEDVLNLELRRFPYNPRENLRAWDAADEYLLAHLHSLALKPRSVLIYNDAFGALSLAVAKIHPQASICVVSDSWMGSQALQANLKLNDAQASIEQLSPEQPLQGQYDLVLFKVPKMLSLLEYQLHSARAHLSEDCCVIGAAMVKDVHNSTIALFSRILGPTTTSLAKKKARLLLCQVDSDLIPPSYECMEGYEAEGLKVQAFPGVFCRDKLDIGSRHFLPHIPASDGYEHIIDLGCGNGLLGCLAAGRNPNAHVSFCDESALAIASARHNSQANDLAAERLSFIQGDCLSSLEANSADLILCNPPFHQQQALTGGISQRMFQQAKKVLRRGGELRVVGNRHLAYHKDLKRLFSNCTQLDSNAKFVVLSAKKL